MLHLIHKLSKIFHPNGGSAIMDVIYNLEQTDPTVIHTKTGDLHYNWYNYAHANMSGHKYNGETVVTDVVMAAPPPPPPTQTPRLRRPKRRFEEKKIGGGKTRNVNKLSIHNLKPKRSKNKRDQKSSKKRSQKAGGRRRSFKSHRRTSPKFNKNN